jgi:glycerophosphoryl diester phosphodiesterase
VPAMLFLARRLVEILASWVLILFTMASGDAPDTKVVQNSDANNPFISSYGQTQLSAHRSGAGFAPQNTLMAFEECVNSKKMNVDIFEFDLHITKDGELILLHNETFDETSNAAEAFGHADVKPKAYTYQELREKLNLGAKFNDGNTAFAKLRGKDIPDNLRVTRLQEVLQYTESHAKRGKQYAYIIELKDKTFDGYRAADKLYATLKEMGLLQRATISTFMPDVGAYVSKTYPDAIRGANPIEVLQFYYYCRANMNLSNTSPRYSVLQLPYDIYLNDNGEEIINLGTKQIVNYAHKYNIAVQYWTINKEEAAKRLIANGADAIMTDYPEEMAKLLED